MKSLLLLIAGITISAAFAQTPTLSAEGQKQKVLHDYLFGPFSESRKPVYKGTGRSRGLKELTIVTESRVIKDGDEIALPEGSERIAVFFRHFGFHG